MKEIFINSLKVLWEFFDREEPLITEAGHRMLRYQTDLREKSKSRIYFLDKYSRNMSGNLCQTFEELLDTNPDNDTIISVTYSAMIMYANQEMKINQSKK